MSADAELLGWVVCANISDHLRGGTEQDRFYQGTRMFSPGTKVYLGEGYWGMGGENMHVIGLRRISRDFVNCAVHVGVLTNFRATSVYSATLWAKLERLRAERFETREDAEDHVSRCTTAFRYACPDKLAPVEKSGPWGPFEASPYRKG